MSNSMMNHISFYIGILGLVFTLLTFINTCRFKRLQRNSAEHNDFRRSINDHVDQIEGFILSIQENELHNDKFRMSVSHFLTDLESRYSFLSFSIKRMIKKLKKALNNPEISAETWDNILEQLIKLKNSLKKERAINE